jgi:glyoxylase-like metal-dependent hydrolase (beta-lactamase superfamily II)/rhodanese-related sulfurtransferase
VEARRRRGRSRDVAEDSMPEYTDTETLRKWLEEKLPVTVVDIRTDEDRQQWSIPGSMHINAYEALKAGKPSALSDAEFPPDRPIVTVCNLGKMSERAADELSRRGLNAVSLAGGMKAWSLSWNTAEIPIDNALVTQIRRTGKGCLSYLISAGREAFVIDASLPPELYRSIAERLRVRIRRVLDTHTHADHLSRSKQLAESVGAELLLPAQDRARFPHRALHTGDLVELGPVKIEAICTPGHTMESMCYFVGGEALFTGDTLFLSSVGRPDLHADVAEAGLRASLLYGSVKQLFGLGPDVRVFPGHTSSPPAFDGIAITERLGVVAERLCDWVESEPAFVDRVLAHIPPVPPNFGRIVELNESGDLPAEDPTDLEAGENRCAVG